MLGKTERIWFVRVQDKPWGPYTATELWLWLTEGRLTADTPCWQEGQSAPIPVSRAIAMQGPRSQAELANESYLPEEFVFPVSPSPGVSRAELETPLTSPSPEIEYLPAGHTDVVIDLILQR